MASQRRRCKGVSDSSVALWDLGHTPKTRLNGSAITPNGDHKGGGFFGNRVVGTEGSMFDTSRICTKAVYPGSVRGSRKDSNKEGVPEFTVRLNVDVIDP